MFNFFEYMVNTSLDKIATIKNIWIRRAMLIIVSPMILFLAAIVVLVEMIEAYIHEVIIPNWWRDK